jgi:ABC-type branched-subunit amino acid transport system substrate-binding protein
MFGIATVPGATGPKKPYTFFAGWPIEQMYQSTFAYVQKFHPQARTIVSMGPEQPDLPQFIDAAKAICPKYGLNWLDVEKFTLDTKDFMPIVSRALAKNPDIIDTTITGGSMAGVCAVLIKQLGEADFKGLILIPCNTEKEVMDEVVPAKYLNRIVINRADPESPIVSEAYRSFCDRFQKKYNTPANSMAALMYNPVKAFFEFLNGQNSMDTTAWMEGFAKYRWPGLFGFETYWVGKKVYGIDRRVFFYPWTSEWIDGKLVTEWSAPIPYEMYVEK